MASWGRNGLGGQRGRMVKTGQRAGAHEAELTEHASLEDGEMAEAPTHFPSKHQPFLQGG